MRIAVHAGTLRGTGSGFVGRQLLEALQRTEHHISAWVPDEWGLARAPRATATKAGLRAKFVVENWDIPRALRSQGCAALLSLGDTSTIQPGRPHVLFVQQAYLAYPPEEWGFQPTHRFRAKLALMELYFRAGMRNVSRLVVQTQDMRSQLLRRWGLPEQRVSVIPTSVSPELRATAASYVRNSEQPPYVICVGTASPHKNHSIIPAVLGQLRNQTATLRVTLNRGEVPALDQALQRANLMRRVEYLGHLQPRDLFRQLGDAAAALLPSVLESFGLTYYEAMALGVPIVAADRGFAREACGDTATYAAVDDPVAFAEGLDRALAYSKSNRQNVANALRRRFDAVHQSWDTIAARFVETVESVV